LTARNNLGDALQAQGKLDLAEEQFRIALQARRRAFGANDPDTLASMHNLAFVLDRRGEHDAAEAGYIDAIAGMRQALGNQDLNTLMALANLGTRQAASGDDHRSAASGSVAEGPGPPGRERAVPASVGRERRRVLA
jgi:Flp pilus assembly protein TadD